jgi:hypothetical protein
MWMPRLVATLAHTLLALFQLPHPHFASHFPEEINQRARKESERAEFIKNCYFYRLPTAVCERLARYQFVAAHVDWRKLRLNCTRATASGEKLISISHIHECLLFYASLADTVGNNNDINRHLRQSIVVVGAPTHQHQRTLTLSAREERMSLHTNTATNGESFASVFRLMNLYNEWNFGK